MSVGLNISDDFEAIVDKIETVKLVRRGAATSTNLTARREPQHQSEAAPSDGSVSQSDVVWHIAPHTGSPPKLGDKLIDAAGQCWTILAITTPRHGLPLRCRARSLAIAWRLDELVTIEAAMWEDHGAGPEITEWRPLRTARARIQPIELSVDHADPDAPTSTGRFEMRIEDVERLDESHRIRDVSGNTYRVEAFRDAKRIDALPLAELTRV